MEFLIMSFKSSQNRMPVMTPALATQLHALVGRTARALKISISEVNRNPIYTIRLLRVGLEDLKKRNPDRAKILLLNVFKETGLNEQEFLDHLDVAEMILS
jgi:hypothetical protein